MTGDDEKPQEIIIVRRRRIGDEGHHGGAWKIAFADFMTAMMALFLVLWLVNASDDDTRKAVASYFNPVKLVDRERSSRGLADPDPTTAKRPRENEKTEGPDDPAKSSEDAFEASPEAVLDKRAEAALAGNAEDGIPIMSEREPDDVSLAALLRPRDPYAVDDTQETEPEAENTDPLLSDIREELKQALPADKSLREAIRVENVPGGTLISLADGPGFAMFDLGSYVPTGRTVLAVAAMAKALENRPGRVRVQGHTDGTPFRNARGRGPKDNWELSTARAHAARLMLVRGGLPEARLGQVAGFAASRPIEGAKPDAPENRRIEILVETP